MVNPSDDAGPRQPLLATATSGPAPESRAKESILLLLIMKLCSNAYEYNMLAYEAVPFEQNDTTICTYTRSPQVSMVNAKVLWFEGIAFMLPVLGGVLSDACLGWRRVMWVGVVLQLFGSCLLAVLDNMGLACQLPLYLLCWALVLLHLSTTDSVILSTLLQVPKLSGTCQCLLRLCLYFAFAALGETLGNAPIILRHFTQRSYQPAIAVCSVVQFVCMSSLGSGDNPAPQAAFQVPRPSRLRRYYLMAGGAVIYLVCLALSRVCLYWQQLRFFTHATGELDFLASYVSLAGYQTATIIFSTCGAIAVFTGCIPSWLSLRMRIRLGLCLMTLTKVPLLIVSVLDYIGSINMEGISGISLWTVYFCFAFLDGVANVLAAIGIYELACCIADKSAKATFIGIFYTVWGLAVMLNGVVLLILKSCNVISLKIEDRSKPLSHYFHATLILMMAVTIAYWEKISWPIAHALYELHIAEEEADFGDAESASTALIN